MTRYEIAVPVLCSGVHGGRDCRSTPPAWFKQPHTFQRPVEVSVSMFVSLEPEQYESVKGSVLNGDQSVVASLAVLGQFEGERSCRFATQATGGRVHCSNHYVFVDRAGSYPSRPKDFCCQHRLCRFSKE